MKTKVQETILATYVAEEQKKTVAYNDAVAALEKAQADVKTRKAELESFKIEMKEALEILEHLAGSPRLKRCAASPPLNATLAEKILAGEGGAEAVARKFRDADSKRIIEEAGGIEAIRESFGIEPASKASPPPRVDWELLGGLLQVDLGHLRRHTPHLDSGEVW